MIAQWLMMVLIWVCLVSCGNDQKGLKTEEEETSVAPLKVAASNRYFENGDGKPFFWLGDTGWLLFVKLNRQEAAEYLELRKNQGFNLIQIMVLHDMKRAVNVYGDSALVHKDAAAPLVTEGNDPEDSLQYDYWDHVEYVVDLAAEKGMYLGLVPVWGSNVKAGKVSVEQATTYASFLAERFGNKRNIVWLNGGDIRGGDSTAVWNAIGITLKNKTTDQMVTFHPRGRTTSSIWFHQEPWLDFNMFQSGHRRYDQDTSKGDLHYGEDNWKYVQHDLQLNPLKPSLDGEPSYEGIPQGLHDTTQPYWNGPDLRRYAYWSALEGAAGFTYGHNAVMQFFDAKDDGSAYGAKIFWREAMKAEGATQMRFLKELMESAPLNSLLPAPELVLNQGERYERIAACQGENYACFYTYTGIELKVKGSAIHAERISAYWYDPRTGKKQSMENIDNEEELTFDPPGDPAPGNDWVLVLEEAK